MSVTFSVFQEHTQPDGKDVSEICVSMASSHPVEFKLRMAVTCMAMDTLCSCYLYGYGCMAVTCMAVTCMAMNTLCGSYLYGYGCMAVTCMAMDVWLLLVWLWMYGCYLYGYGCIAVTCMAMDV